MTWVLILVLTVSARDGVTSQQVSYRTLVACEGAAKIAMAANLRNEAFCLPHPGA